MGLKNPELRNVNSKIIEKRSELKYYREKNRIARYRVNLEFWDKKVWITRNELRIQRCLTESYIYNCNNNCKL